MNAIRKIGQFVEFKDPSGEWVIGVLTSERTKFEGRSGYHLKGVLGGKYFIYNVRDVRVPAIKGVRSKTPMQFPFTNCSDRDLRDALISVGFTHSSAVWTTRTQRINLLRAMGFNAIETRAPSARPDGTTARPCVMLDATAYVASFGIAATQCWATENEIYLKVDDDSKTLAKLVLSNLGAPKHQRFAGGGQCYTFKTAHGVIHVTRVIGTQGKQFVIRIINN